MIAATYIFAPVIAHFLAAMKVSATREHSVLPWHSGDRRRFVGTNSDLRQRTTFHAGQAISTDE